MWSADYMHEGQPRTLPVLVSADRFKAFCSDYKLLRGVGKTKRQNIRAYLTTPGVLRGIFRPDGAGIDELASRLGRSFETGMHRSLLSKIASLARPAVFNPWDEFACKGAARLGCGKFVSYQEYLICINCLWVRIGPSIFRAARTRDVRFGRRVLDNYLMAVGGRWSAMLGTDLAHETVVRC
jgi:hypothetical protein